MPSKSDPSFSFFVSVTIVFYLLVRKNMDRSTKAPVWIDPTIAIKAQDRSFLSLFLRFFLWMQRVFLSPHHP